MVCSNETSPPPPHRQACGPLAPFCFCRGTASPALIPEANGGQVGANGSFAAGKGIPPGSSRLAKNKGIKRFPPQGFPAFSTEHDQPSTHTHPHPRLGGISPTPREGGSGAPPLRGPWGCALHPARERTSTAFLGGPLGTLGLPTQVGQKEPLASPRLWPEQAY